MLAPRLPCRLIPLLPNLTYARETTHFGQQQSVYKNLKTNQTCAQRPEEKPFFVETELFLRFSPEEMDTLSKVLCVLFSAEWIFISLELYISRSSHCHSVHVSARTFYSCFRCYLSINVLWFRGCSLLRNSHRNCDVCFTMRECSAQTAIGTPPLTCNVAAARFPE